MPMKPEYTEEFNELKSIFDPGIKEIKIPGSQVRIVNLIFSSGFKVSDFSNREDISINENITFSYPVFIPHDMKKGKVILLLHGLNERSWAKYLTWAHRLCENTQSYVVLFPISFHINRSPHSWIEPRMIMQSLKERQDKFNGLKMSSFANIALSNRLTSDPLRFFTSGYQTASDIIRLLLDIQNGNHEIIPEKSTVNLFAYSIGAFLAQILMIGNPENLFGRSRLFMFCGGSVFSGMQGTSKYIMDSLAFERLYRFYMDDFEKEVRKHSLLFELLRSSQLGTAFQSMLDLGSFRSFREDILSKLKEQVRSIALLKDSVIPAASIGKTLVCVSRHARHVFEVWDFPFPYSHENPFPVFNNSMGNEVDKSLNRLISEASMFLA